jgi:hypothetical protein
LSLFLSSSGIAFARIFWRLPTTGSKVYLFSVLFRCFIPIYLVIAAKITE